MALQGSGQISLGDIATEFGGTAPHQMSEYYGSGGAPGSGELRISDFYGLANKGPSYINYLTTLSNNFANAEDTFSSVSFGSIAATNRVIVVCITVTTPNAISAMTIGGVAATQAATVGQNYIGKGEIWYAAQNSTTSGDIVISTGNVNGGVISVYSVNDVASTTPVETQASLTVNATLTFSNNSSDDAVFLCVGGAWHVDDNLTVGGTSGMIERNEFYGLVNGTDHNQITGSVRPGSAITNPTVTFGGQTDSNYCNLAAFWE